MYRLIDFGNDMRKHGGHRMKNGSYLAVAFQFRRVTCINRYSVLRRARESYSVEVLAYSSVIFKSCRYIRYTGRLQNIVIPLNVRNVKRKSQIFHNAIKFKINAKNAITYVTSHICTK